MKMNWGEGLPGEEYELLVEDLKRKLQAVAMDFYQQSMGILVARAKMLARCSKWQYQRLRKSMELGRVTRVGDLLDKVRLYGAGLMAVHLVKNLGITAETFCSLTDGARETLNVGTVLIKSRNDVISVKASKLDEKQMARVVSSSRSGIGAQILEPERQSDSRGRREGDYYAPVAMEKIDGAVIVTCSLKESSFRVRFATAQVKKLMRVAKVSS